MEVLKVPLEKEEEKGEEFELSLELSIGGRYAKTEDSRVEKGGDNDNNNNCGAVVARSDFSCEPLDLQRRREVQALRRQEARKKREEKLKKSRWQNVNFGFVEDDRLFLEAQKFQARVEEREVREREGFSEELARKQDKINGGVNGGVVNDLNLCLYPKVQQQQPCWGPNVNGAVDCESEQSNGMIGGSSPVSDYQSTSQKGGSSSDTGSHSSPLRSGHHHHGISCRHATDQPESNDSSSHTEPVTEKPKLNPHSDQTNSNNNICLTSANPATETSIGLNDKPKPPKPPNHNHNLNIASSIPRMPRVSATGNGPNGKTITGFLYKYTKTEVSIMCVCHGSSFSPAGFVEHAGGVDVSHPLRHITIVPSAFG